MILMKKSNNFPQSVQLEAIIFTNTYLFLNLACVLVIALISMSSKSVCKPYRSELICHVYKLLLFTIVVYEVRLRINHVKFVHCCGNTLKAQRLILYSIDSCRVCIVP